MDWVHLAKSRGQWQVLVNRVSKFGFHTMQGISRLAEEMAATQNASLLHSVVRCIQGRIYARAKGSRAQGGKFPGAAY
jgi:hypothetical protein